MIEEMVAPNRYRKMIPTWTHDYEDRPILAVYDYYAAKYKQYGIDPGRSNVSLSKEKLYAKLQQEVREKMKEEFPEKWQKEGLYAVGLGYSFNKYDEVIIWDTDPSKSNKDWYFAHGFIVLGDAFFAHVAV